MNLGSGVTLYGRELPRQDVTCQKCGTLLWRWDGVRFDPLATAHVEALRLLCGECAGY